MHPIAAAEIDKSLQTPDILTNGVAVTCAELDIPIVIYSPLARGLLIAAITKVGDIDLLIFGTTCPTWSRKPGEELGGEK